MAKLKTTYLDGEVIYRQGEVAENQWEILSGSVDLIIEGDGGQILEKKLNPGQVFGNTIEPNKYTAQANGATILKEAELNKIPKKIDSGNTLNSMDKGELVSLLTKNDLLGANPLNQGNTTTPYNNPSLLQRLLNGLGKNEDRIGIRVAPLLGENSAHHTRQIVAALGNDNFIQTRLIQKSIFVNLNEDVLSQTITLFNEIRNDLAYQGADILVWGHILSPKNKICLKFIPLTMWDQQAPGAFNLETEMVLPSDFGKLQIDFLRFVTISAALQSVPKKSPIHTRMLRDYAENALQALEGASKNCELHERAELDVCYASALCTLSLPNYEKDLLDVALKHFHRALSLVDKENRSFAFGHIQKHIGSILHIEADRIDDLTLLERAIEPLKESVKSLDKVKHAHSWAAAQHRLGLIFYRQGLNLGDAALLRGSIEHYRLALDVYDRQNNLKRWAEIMGNFAQALQVLGEHTQSLEALATSANACLAILEVKDRSKTPVSWAATQNNLGSALFLLGKRTRNCDRLKKSINAFDKCLNVYKDMNADNLASITLNNLRRAKDMLTNFEWENSIANEFPRDPSGLPEPGEGLIKRPRVQQNETLRKAS